MFRQLMELQYRMRLVGDAGGITAHPPRSPRFRADSAGRDVGSWLIGNAMGAACWFKDRAAAPPLEVADNILSVRFDVEQAGNPVMEVLLPVCSLTPSPAGRSVARRILMNNSGPYQTAAAAGLQRTLRRFERGGYDWKTVPAASLLSAGDLRRAHARTHSGGPPDFKPDRFRTPEWLAAAPGFLPRKPPQ